MIIEGFDRRGNVACTFTNYSDMSEVLEVPESVIFEHFRVNRQYTAHNIIYHIKEEDEVVDDRFEEDFGYPQTGFVSEDNMPEGLIRVDMVVPAGSILVTPNDEIHADVSGWYENREEEKEEKIVHETTEAEHQAEIEEELFWDEMLRTMEVHEAAKESFRESGKCNHSDITEEQAHAMQQELDETLEEMPETLFGDIFDLHNIKTFETPVEEDEMEVGLGGEDGGDYSANGSSAHYKKAVLEYIDKEERCYGTFMAYGLCFMQVDKYRDRAGKKEGVPVHKDMTKASWYDIVASEYFLDKIGLNNIDFDLVDTDEVQVRKNFDDKYGAGRHTYINMPTGLRALLSGEFDEELRTPLKGLGDIVNEIQN